MFKLKIVDLFIIFLVVIVIVLAAGLILGLNRIAAQAHQAPVEQVEPASSPPLGTILVEEQANEATLAYQGVFTNPNANDFPPEEELQLGEVVIQSAAVELEGANLGLGAQSVNFGAEFVPASALRYDGDSPANEYRFWPDEGYLRNNSDDDMCVAAPVYLPDGGTITAFRMYFVDSHPDLAMEKAFLWRKKMDNPPGAAAEHLSNLLDLADPNLAVNQIFLLVATNPGIVSGRNVIDNRYSYYVSFCFYPNTGINHRLYGFRVDYNPPN